jgi:ABC-type proline/glycine betaine transport system ATPase subunit
METLRLVGLGEWAHALPSQLSGGTQQPVVLAMALAIDVHIFLMDQAYTIIKNALLRC